MMRCPRVLAAVFLASAAVLAAAPPALAQPHRAPPPTRTDPRLAEAKRYFEDGAAAYGQGNYEAAIRAWERAYEISQKPLIFESIANAWERLGDARKARDYLARWRSSAPLEERDLLDARIRNLDARVAREDEAARRTASERAAAQAAARVQIEQAQQQPWLLGAIVAGAGGVVVLTGVLVDVAAALKRPDASLCKTTNGQTFCKAAAQGPIDLSNRLALAGDITWALGAAAVAAGAVLIFIRRPGPVQRDSAPRPVAAPPAAWLAPAPGGVMLGGRF
jgi:tetratricopeptide (TPR) repeat protein